MTEPTVVTVRTLLAHFRSTLETARQTGEPVVIALRRRKPTAVLLGYEVWPALALRQTGQADTAALQASLLLQGSATAAYQSWQPRRRVEEMNRDLAAARQRLAELAVQLAKPQTASQSGEAWGVEPLPEPAHGLPETWPSPIWGISWHAEAPAGSGWGQQ